jgi:tetratricopeptide (TPR) repeat protein
MTEESEQSTYRGRLPRVFVPWLLGLGLIWGGVAHVVSGLSNTIDCIVSFSEDRVTACNLSRGEPAKDWGLEAVVEKSRLKAATYKADHEDVVQSAERLIALNAADADVYSDRAYALYSLDRPEEALKAYVESYRLDRDRDVIFSWVIYLSRQSADFDTGRMIAKEHVSHHPRKFEGYEALAQIELDALRMPEAEIAAAEAVKQKADSGDLRILYAKALAKNGKKDLALVQASEAVRLAGDVTYLMYDIAATYQAWGERALARDTLVKIVQKERTTYALTQLADVYIDESQYTPADSLLREALTIDATDTSVHDARLKLLYAQGDFAGLDQALKEMRSLQLNTDQMTYWRARADMELGLNDVALKGFFALVDSNPSWGEIRCDIGLALLDLGKRDDAKSHFDSCLELAPDAVYSHVSLASAKAKQNQWAESQSHADRALSLDKTSVSAMAHRAHALWKLNNILAARELFDKAVVAGPDYVVARRLKAEFHVAMKEFTAAETEIRKLSELKNGQTASTELERLLARSRL